jgi:hypothetical protein
VESPLVREALSLFELASLWLKRSQAEQCQPMRMALAGHYFARAFALTLRTSAAHEALMVQVELQLIQIRIAEMTPQRKVSAQPRIQVLHQRAAARRLRHRLADGVEHGSVKNLGLRCELDRLLSQTVIQNRSPDLKHVMSPLRRPAHLPSLVHSCVDQLIDCALGP